MKGNRPIIITTIILVLSIILMFSSQTPNRDETIGYSLSPDDSMMIAIYRNNGYGATVGYTIIADVEFIGRGYTKNIYKCYHENYANYGWSDSMHFIINGCEFDFSNGTKYSIINEYALNAPTRIAKSRDGMYIAYYYEISKDDSTHIYVDVVNTYSWTLSNIIFDANEAIDELVWDNGKLYVDDVIVWQCDPCKDQESRQNADDAVAEGLYQRRQSCQRHI